MPIFSRLGELIWEDLGALVPGSGVAFTRETFARLLLYVAFVIFIIRLFVPWNPAAQRPDRFEKLVPESAESAPATGDFAPDATVPGEVAPPEQNPKPPHVGESQQI